MKKNNDNLEKAILILNYEVILMEYILKINSKKLWVSFKKDSVSLDDLLFELNNLIEVDLSNKRYVYYDKLFDRYFKLFIKCCLKFDNVKFISL